MTAEPLVLEGVEPQPAWQAERVRRWIYPALLAVFYVSWTTYMVSTDSWRLFIDHWTASLTMAFGSFVAGATAEGGAAVAFPVFTKVLGIDASTARTFGLLIQSAGMTFASIFIIARRVPILPRVIVAVSMGGVLGQVLGTYVVGLAGPASKILFTLVATAFGLAMAISRWVLDWTPRAGLPSWGRRSAGMFFAIGIAGGIVAANTGSGIDMLTFIVLTLAIGIDEKVSTPTTVVIMAINSLVGMFLHTVVSQDVGIAFEYWLVAAPIVVLGAPAGAYFASRATRDTIIVFLLVLISVELVSTLILVPFDAQAIRMSVAGLILCGGWFWAMLHYRHRSPATDQPLPRTADGG